MFDNLKLFVFNYTSNEFEDLLILLSIYYPKIDKNGSTYFDLGNLRFNYYPNSGKLRIRNSIHKFYNESIKKLGRTNSTVFKYEDFIELVKYLCKILNRKSQEINVGGDFEFGVNITLPKDFDVYKIITRYDYYKSTTFNPFTPDKPYRGKPYQVSCALSDYRIKFYDKNKQEKNFVSLSNLLRYEIVIENKRKLYDLLMLQDENSITLQDLEQLENWCALANFLEDTYNNIVKKPILSNELNLEKEDLEEIHTILNYQFYEDIKDSLPELARQVRQETKRLSRSLENCPYNLHYIVHKYLDYSIQELLYIQ